MVEIQQVGIQFGAADPLVLVVIDNRRVLHVKKCLVHTLDLANVLSGVVAKSKVDENIAETIGLLGDFPIDIVSHPVLDSQDDQFCLVFDS